MQGFFELRGLESGNIIKARVGAPLALDQSVGGISLCGAATAAA